MFHISGDPNPRHNLPLEPMLDDVTGSLLIVGLIIVLSKWRQPLYLLFVFWLFIMLLPGILSVPWESPQSLRSIGVIPAVIIIALFPVVLFWHLSKSHSYLIIRRISVFALLFLFGFIGYLNLSIYFGKQAGHPEVFSDFSTSETIMAKEMVKQSQNGYTLYSSRQFLYSLTASVVSGNVHYEPLFAPRDLPISPERVLNGAAIYLEPRDSGMYELLAEYYPSAKFRVITAPNGEEPILYEVLISKDQLKNTTGVEVCLHAQDTERSTTPKSPWCPSFGKLTGYGRLHEEGMLIKELADAIETRFRQGTQPMHLAHGLEELDAVINHCGSHYQDRTKRRTRANRLLQRAWDRFSATACVKNADCHDFTGLVWKSLHLYLNQGMRELDTDE